MNVTGFVRASFFAPATLGRCHLSWRRSKSGCPLCRERRSRRRGSRRAEAHVRVARTPESTRCSRRFAGSGSPAARAGRPRGGAHAVPLQLERPTRTAGHLRPIVASSGRGGYASTAKVCHGPIRAATTRGPSYSGTFVSFAAASARTAASRRAIRESAGAARRQATHVTYRQSAADSAPVTRAEPAPQRRLL